MLYHLLNQIYNFSCILFKPLFICISPFTHHRHHNNNKLAVNWYLHTHILCIFSIKHLYHIILIDNRDTFFTWHFTKKSKFEKIDWVVIFWLLVLHPDTFHGRHTFVYFPKVFQYFFKTWQKWRKTNFASLRTAYSV